MAATQVCLLLLSCRTGSSGPVQSSHRLGLVQYENKSSKAVLCSAALLIIYAYLAVLLSFLLAQLNRTLAY